MIPYVPVSEALLPPDFVTEEYPVIAQSCSKEPRCEAEGWSPFATMARAIIDARGAWKEAMATPDSSFSRDSPAGNGNSRLNTLYWIATRPELARADAADSDPSLARLAAAPGAPRAVAASVPAAVLFIVGIVGVVGALTSGTHALAVARGRQLALATGGEGVADALLGGEGAGRDGSLPHAVESAEPELLAGVRAPPPVGL